MSYAGRVDDPTYREVVGLVRVEPGGSATVVEQYTYSPYGQVVYADILDAEAPLSRAGFQGLFFDRFDAPRDGQTLAPTGDGQAPWPAPQKLVQVL